MVSETLRPPPQKIAAVVLVVDDESELRQMAADLLSGKGYEVLQARHGREAMEQLLAHAPDLVVLDLNMPVMDGWQFLSEQQRLADEQLTAIPVLLLTGEDSSDNHLAACKAAGVIRKPFDADELLTAVETVLHS